MGFPEMIELDLTALLAGRLDELAIMLLVANGLIESICGIDLSTIVVKINQK